MFICSVCKKSSNPGEKCVKVVAETRKKVYSHRTFNGRKKLLEEAPDREGGFKKTRKVVDPGGVGYETVKEHSMCPRCLKAEAGLVSDVYSNGAMTGRIKATDAPPSTLIASI